MVSTMQANIQIIDYGMGNLRSVQKALERVNYQAQITSRAEDVRKADKIILPGVGAFGDGMARLHELRLIDPVKEHIQRGKPFLGICLGLQLLFDKSSENGEHVGMRVLSGEVVSFSPRAGIKVPHMGWNAIHFKKPCPIFRGVAEGAHVYFVHSYYAIPQDDRIIVATANYPTPFAAALWANNIYATQFHPEKSQQVGLTILRNFAEL
jgi:glutamine amidotransferase